MLPTLEVIQFRLQVVKALFSLLTLYNPFDLLLYCHQCPIKKTSVLFQAPRNGWYFANNCKFSAQLKLRWGAKNAISKNNETTLDQIISKIDAYVE